jgi:hypothetical protein
MGSLGVSGAFCAAVEYDAGCQDFGARFCAGLSACSCKQAASGNSYSCQGTPDTLRGTSEELEFVRSCLPPCPVRGTIGHLLQPNLLVLAC